MKKIKIGIPRALYYYYFGSLYTSFFEEMGCDVIVSPKTNYEILSLGCKYTVDEMCLSMKIFLGHVAYLQEKCDYIVIPRIDNYGVDEQTCTNFLAIYDIVANLFTTPILHYNIDLEKGEDELRGFLQIGRALKLDDIKVMKAYEKALEKDNASVKKRIKETQNTFMKSGIKVLVVAHPYNIYDEMVGKPILKILESMGVTLIYSDAFDREVSSLCSKSLSKDLYFKYSKENLGSIVLSQDKIDGILFLSSFPCALDSLAYELAFRKIEKPYLHLVIDDVNIGAGIETRLESFVDILEQKKYAK